MKDRTKIIVTLIIGTTICYSIMSVMLGIKESAFDSDDYWKALSTITGTFIAALAIVSKMGGD